MERLIFVPIEILEERYSKQWFEWFMRDFALTGIDPIVVGDQQERKISSGQFLDIYETNSYKLKQIIEIIDLLKKYPEDSFTIFFMDAWFAGIEAISYIKSCAKRKLKIKGMIHAGTWDQHDFLTQSGCSQWSKGFEESLFSQFDEIFYATDFHKKIIESYFTNQLPCKFTKVSWPVIDRVSWTTKENIVVFPHRLAPEKNPQQFEEIEKLFRQKYGHILSNISFIKTKDVCKNKNDYYALLGKAKVSVSCAAQETFGIAMVESFNMGCFPVVPDRLSYQEVFPASYRYQDLEQAADLVFAGLQNYSILKPLGFGSKINWINKILE